MIWRPKEKDLTPEEAVALAKRELAPFWIGSEPLLAAIRSPEDGRVSIFPLDPEFGNRARLLVFANLTDFSMVQIAHYTREWHYRYTPHGLQILIVAQSRYSEFRVPAVVAKQLKKFAIPAPAVIDQEGLFSKALGAHDLPFMALLFQKDVVFTYDSRDWVAKTEQSIQLHLRTADPGLPLPPVHSPTSHLIRPVGSVELGRGRGAEFPAPGFQLTDSGLGAARFGENTSAAPRPGSLKAFSISGAWAQDADRIMTSDPTAVLTFYAPGREVAIIARALDAGAPAQARIVAEVNGIAAIDVNCGSDLFLDEEGRSCTQVGGLGSYYLLTVLPSDGRLVTLRFPKANKVPVALYGLRFGD